MRIRARDKKSHHIKWLLAIYQDYLNLLTKELTHNLNPWMIALEKF
jgi:hypothetical protein